MAMNTRPDLPKRFAARIRGAQEKVRQKRLEIAYGEKSYEKSSDRVAEYESDPDSFASRYYGGLDPSSYPVQTNVERNRERNYHHEQRRDEHIAELAELETRLIRMEAEVLVDVSRMRPTQGRVPWPRKLPTRKRFRDQIEVQMQREDERWRLDRAKDDALFEKLMANEEERGARESAKQDEELRRTIDAMPPTEYAHYRAWADYLTSGLRSGQLTMTEVFDIIQGSGKLR